MRPTNYTPELLEAARDYITSCEADNTAGNLPSVVGLCRKLKISRSIAYDWAKDKDKEFSDILEEVSQMQEEMLIKFGLTGTYNSTITKLMLTKHGYSDKQEVDNNISGGVEFTSITRTILNDKS